MREDPALQRRALALFERLTDDPPTRAFLTRDEPPEVLAILARLEGSAARARASFPTEEDWSGAPAAMALPERIGPYRLGPVLGEGGMGLVFLAERCDGMFERTVAVKLLHPARFGPAALARFSEERRLLARLDHPGIVGMLDGGIAADGWPFIVMEHVAGQPIDAHADHARLGLSARVRLVRDACRAVAAAHGARVVHGDLKPGNILVDAEGRVRLLDFGIARMIDGEVQPGNPHTAHYAAPERIAGEAPSVAAEIFALGILLKRLAGRGDPARPETMRIADRELAAVARRASAAAPRERYSDATALAADLDRWLDRRPVTARRGLPHHIRLATRRHPLAATALPLLLLVAALAAALIVESHRAARTRFAEERALARYQLTVVDRQLASQPGSLKLRTRLAADVQTMLDRMADAREATPAFRVEVAGDYRRLALLQGSGSSPSLDDVPAARRSIARGKALLAGIGTSEARNERARLLIVEALMAATATDLAAARRLVGEIAPLVADAPSALRADYLFVASETAQWEGQFTRAAALARRGLALLPAQDGDAAAVLRRARGLDLAAEAQWYAGQEAAAVAPFATAVQALERATARWPEDRAIRTALTRARWTLGTTLVGLKDYAPAVTLLEQAWSAARSDAAADPDDATAARRLRVQQFAYGQALAGAGELPEALALLHRSVAARFAWWRRAPGDARRQRDWVIGIAALADVLAPAGRRDEACRLYGQAGVAIARLAAADRLSPLDRRATVRLLAEGKGRYCAT
jgi:tetratricopeptide (TPR) repeat protein